MNAYEVKMRFDAGLVESNGSLPLGDDLKSLAG